VLLTRLTRSLSRFGLRVLMTLVVTSSLAIAETPKEASSPFLGPHAIGTVTLHLKGALAADQAGFESGRSIA